MPLVTDLFVVPPTRIVLREVEGVPETTGKAVAYWRFGNGFGAAVLNYGGGQEEDLLEFCVLGVDGKPLEQSKICTGILSYLTVKEVNYLLKRTINLEKQVVDTKILEISQKPLSMKELEKINFNPVSASFLADVAGALSLLKKMMFALPFGDERRDKFLEFFEENVKICFPAIDFSTLKK